MSSVPVRATGTLLSFVLLVAPVRARTTDGQASGLPQQREPIVRVESFEDIRARPGEEQVRAAIFDREGQPLRERPNIYEGPAEIPLSPGEPPKPLLRQRRLHDAVCGAEAVVVGYPTSKRVLLNRSETALFTDFTFEVGQWLRPGRLGPSIVVSGFGGRVIVAGKVYTTGITVLLDNGWTRYDRPEGLALRIEQPYLLFLRRLPKTQAFGTNDEPIHISNGTVDLVLLGPVQDPRGPEPFQKLVMELEAAARRCP